MTTCGATSDDQFDILTTLGFQCKPLIKLVPTFQMNSNHLHYQWSCQVNQNHSSNISIITVNTLHQLHYLVSIGFGYQFAPVSQQDLVTMPSSHLNHHIH